MKNFSTQLWTQKTLDKKKKLTEVSIQQFDELCYQRELAQEGIDALMERGKRLGFTLGYPVYDDEPEIPGRRDLEISHKAHLLKLKTLNDIISNVKVDGVSENF